MSSNKLIKLQSKEGDIRCLSAKVAEISVTLKDIIENSMVTQTPVPLSMISTKVLDKIIEWIEYHSNDCDSEEENVYNSSAFSMDIKLWDKNYFDIERELLFDILIAANYLNIQNLLSIGCKIAAQKLRGKTAKEVRKLWKIKCDLDPEVEKQIIQKNSWTENQ